jgi:hypothetical protein
VGTVNLIVDNTAVQAAVRKGSAKSLAVSSAAL